MSIIQLTVVFTPPAFQNTNNIFGVTVSVCVMQPQSLTETLDVTFGVREKNIRL